MPDRDPPVEQKPGPPQGRVPRMMSRPGFIIAITIFLLGIFALGFYA